VLHFDLYTLSIATIINLLLTSFAMLMFWSVNRDLAGIKWYCIANFMVCGGFLLLLMSAMLPGRQIILAAHLLLFAGAMLQLHSIRTFRLLNQIPIYVTATATAIYIFLIAYWLFAHDDMNARAVISSPVFALISVCSAFSMAIRVPAKDRAVYWSTAAFFSLHAISFTIRATHALSGNLIGGEFATKALDLMSLVTLNLAVTGCAFGLSTAIALRCRRDTELLALYDPLTLLPNRRLFEDRLERAHRQAVRSQRRIALVYCDLDRFKEVNDALGHVAGDEVLRIIARRLGEVIHESACLARIGGDEFLLLLENVRSRDEVFAVMDQLKQAMSEEIVLPERRLLMDISCGHALFPEDVDTAQDLIRQADVAMYSMKRETRDSMPVYT
jgi:diguanylate cyclase (GGDEF)-like protein